MSHKFSRKGIGIVQVLVALALAGGLAIVVAQLATTIGKSNFSSNMSTLAAQMETKVRTAMTSNRGMANTRLAVTNNAFDPCFGAGCNIPALIPIELRDAGDVVLIPKGTSSVDPWVTIDDAGVPCTPGPTQPTCRWKAQIQMRPVCPGFCSPDTYQIKYILSWNAAAAGVSSFVMKDREIDINAPREQFNAPPTGGDCGPVQMMYGVNMDGSPMCRPLPECSFTGTRCGCGSDEVTDSPPTQQIRATTKTCISCIGGVISTWTQHNISNGGQKTDCSGMGSP